MAKYVINIGLGKGYRVSKYTTISARANEAYRWLRKLGDHEAQLVPGAEPTIVARFETDAKPDFDALCNACDQDCVAVLRDGWHGYLTGPYSHYYGNFDPRLFTDWK